MHLRLCLTFLLLSVSYFVFSTGMEDGGRGLVSYRTRSQMFLIMRLLRWKSRFIKAHWGRINRDDKMHNHERNALLETTGRSLTSFWISCLVTIVWPSMCWEGFLLAHLESSYLLVLGCPSDFGKRSCSFMIIRWSISWFVYQWCHLLPACERQMSRLHFC